MDMQEKYRNKVVPTFRTEFGYSNIFSVPKIEKVVVNAGVGRIRDEKQHEEVRKFLMLITGQKPAARPAKKAIASFTTRQGLTIGYQVTLRGRRMYEFLSRLVNIALPRTRDFRGISEKSFDAQGHLTIGVREHMVFPEMLGEDYKFLFGFEITVVTTAKSPEEGIALLKLMGFPIKKEDKE